MKTATLEWLRHETLLYHPDLTTRERYLVEISEQPDQTPEQPEPLAFLRKFRRFQTATLLYGGGHFNQPYLFMLELNAVIDAELEWDAIQAVNRRLQESRHEPH